MGVTTTPGQKGSPETDNFPAGLRFKGIVTDDPAESGRQFEAYLSSLKAMDFRRCRALPRYYATDFFDDGEFRQFDLDVSHNTLTIEMESIQALNEVYNLRPSLGLPRDMENHRCEDFTYTSTFRGVAHFAWERGLIDVVDGQTGETRVMPRNVVPDSYDASEIMDSPLRRRVSAKMQRDLYHLRILTHNNACIDVVFERVNVRKTNAVKLESYTGGQRIKLLSLYRG